MKMNKKYMTFGLIGLFAMVFVTAGLIQYYGQVTQEVNVEQAVSAGTVGFNNNIIAGSSLVKCDSVKNNAEVDAVIRFGTRCNNSIGYDDGTQYVSEIDWSDFSNDRCDGIVTEIYGTLELTKKDGDWQPTGNSEDEITIRYTIVGDTFEYNVISGNIPSGYELVYAMDKEDRFNPGDYATVKTVAQINSQGEGLPMVGDWNAIADPGYCNNDNGKGDYFEHCTGAKLWIIPTSSFDAGTGIVNSWSNFYWETDLIVYSNNANNEITLPANGGGFDFCVENDFAINLMADNYTIETKILPVA